MIFVGVACVLCLWIWDLYHIISFLLIILYFRLKFLYLCRPVSKKSHLIRTYQRRTTLDVSYITLCSLLSLLALIPYSLYFFRNSLTFSVKTKSRISKTHLSYSSTSLSKWPVPPFLDICVTDMGGKRSTCMASYV